MDFVYVKGELKTVFLNLLATPLDEVDFDFKNDVIRTIKEVKLYKDKDYIHQLIKALGEYDNHRLISGVLGLIKKCNPEDFLEYIQNVTPKILDDSKKNYPQSDNFMSDEKDVLKEIVIKLNATNCVYFKLNTILYNEYTLKFEKKDVENTINELIIFYPENKMLVYELGILFLVDDLKKSNDFFDFTDMMRTFFTATNTIAVSYTHLTLPTKRIV